eukprot:1178611-Prymnesium_polylepis.1
MERASDSLLAVPVDADAHATWRGGAGVALLRPARLVRCAAGRAGTSSNTRSVSPPPADDSLCLSSHGMMLDGTRFGGGTSTEE